MKPIFADFQTDVRHTCYLKTIRMSNSQKQNDSYLVRESPMLTLQMSLNVRTNQSLFSSSHLVSNSRRFVTREVLNVKRRFVTT